MSKLLLSNCDYKEHYLHEIFQKSGFSKFSNLNCDSIYGKIYKKLNIDNENFLEIGSDYIGTIGTILYEGTIGRKALLLMYADLKIGVNIRKNAIGNYIIIIKLGSKIRIFTDDSAIISLYYYSVDGDWAITNTYYHLGRLLDVIEENTEELIEDAFQNAIIGNSTPIKNIYRLEENQVIIIDTLTAGLSVVTNIFKNDRSYSYDSLIKQICNNGDKLVRNFKKFAVFMTGGLDSRLMLGILLRNKVTPTLIYGVGDSPLTNTKNDDLIVVDSISAKLNLDKQIINWKTDIPFDENWDLYLERYGELSTIYCGNKNIFNYFEQNKNHEYITFGYFGEFLKTIEWIDTINEDNYTLKQFVDLYFNDRIKFEEKEEIYRVIYSKFLRISKVYNLDSLNISKNDFHLLHYHYRKVADNVMCNFVNNFCYSTIILSDSIILKNILNYPYNDKKNGRLVLRLLKDLYPEILQYPIFSHCKEMHYDNITEKLYVSNKIKRHELIKTLIKKFPVVNNLVYSIISRFRHNRYDTSKIFKGFTHDLEKFGYSALLSNNIDVRHIVKYLQNKHLLDTLKLLHRGKE